MSIYIYIIWGYIHVVLVSSYPKIIYKRLIVISFWPKGIQTKFLILAFINCKILLLWRLNQSIHLYVPNSLISFLHSTYMAWIYFISLVFKASFEGIYCFVTKHPQISSLNLTLLVYLTLLWFDWAQQHGTCLEFLTTQLSEGVVLYVKMILGAREAVCQLGAQPPSIHHLPGQHLFSVTIQFIKIKFKGSWVTFCLLLTRVAKDLWPYLISSFPQTPGGRAYADSQPHRTNTYLSKLSKYISYYCPVLFH